MLLPCFGCFMPTKKECVITLDGLFESSLEEVYRPSLIININQDTLLPKRIGWIKIENKELKDESELIGLLKELEKDYNIIVHTNDIKKIEELILKDLYSLGVDSSIGIGTFIKEKTTQEWFDFILEIRNAKGVNNEF